MADQYRQNMMNKFYLNFILLHSFILNIMMRASRLNPQSTFYLQVNKQGKTNIVLGSKFQRLSENSYRQVHFEGAFTNDQDDNELYEDEYQIDLGQQFQNCDDVIIRRLGAMYSKNRRPTFINNELLPTQPKEGIKFVNSVQSYPHLVEQISLFPTVHYCGLFITQDFRKNGKYRVIINNQGRFQVFTVDDRIPIDKKTYEPIWGLSFERPWEIILVKAWAKKLMGYHKVLASKPFEFIEAFSNSAWKYFNLTKTQRGFLDKYLKFSMMKEGKILLKTKDEATVRQHGLQQNSLAYTVCGGNIQQLDKSIPSHMIAINSTYSTSWEGQNGFLDKNCEKLFKEMNPDIHLNRGFIMSGEDAINNFASAHITSLRQKNFVTGYKVLEIPANEKKAQYFQFVLPEDGFFDFCIKQFDENIITVMGEQSAVKSRYRHVKYMVIRDNAESSGSHLSSIHPPAGNSNIYTTNAKQYKQPRFMVYQIEYSRGYNKGDAHFLTLPKGRYIFRIKSQTSKHNARYSVNWVSSSKIYLNDATLTDDEKVELLHDSFVSIMHKSQNYCFEKGKKTEMISYGNQFLKIGYGFVAVKSTTQSPYSIVVEVDPNQLKKQGYALKGKYKGLSEPFNVLIERGQYDSFVLKLVPGTKEYLWPTNGFKIWKKQNKEIEGGASSSKINESNLRNSPGESNIRGSSYKNEALLNSDVKPIKPIQEAPHQEDEWNEIEHHQVNP